MQAIDDYVFVFVTSKYIQQLNNSKAYKIHAFWVVKFVVTAHDRIQ